MPLTDLERFDRFLFGYLWTSEFGDPSQPVDLAFLSELSPYRTALGLDDFPATLITTAANDSRVHPMHARKLAAAMQNRNRRTRGSVMFIEDTSTGHGAGRNTRQLCTQYSDALTFLMHHLSVERRSFPHRPHQRELATQPQTPSRVNRARPDTSDLGH